jgi:DNA replication protein DnaC
MAPPRARNWQSQRVTPRSGAPGTGFHPEPAHRGQTSAAVFIIASRFVQEFDPRDGAGLLLVGGIGTGKTHLGVGTLKKLIAARGSACLFATIATC